MRTTPLAVLVLLAGCASVPAGPTPPANDPAPVLVIADGDGAGVGISVADALGRRATDDLVSVTGALFVDAGGTVRLCDAIAESFPPQCGGERIEVDGLDLATIDGMEEANGVQWAESVTLFGSVE